MKQILVVDDDIAVSGVITEALAGYDLLVADDGHDALQLAANTRLDLLVTDYFMPSMSGDELIGRLRERQADLKVLVLTAYAKVLEDANVSWWLTERHLAKPFTIAALRGAVAELIGPP